MQRKFQKGFSLTEVAIAIFIMVMGVVWVYSAINDMIRVSNNAVNRLEAGFLATEGMEFIKNKRDQNYLDYLNSQSGSGLGGCPDGYKDDFNLRCNWMFGIRGVSPIVYNIDQNDTSYTPVSLLPNECNPNSIHSLLAGSDDDIRKCLEKIYEGDTYKFLFRNADGVYSLTDSSANEGKKTQYKRMIVVSRGELFPESNSFPNKYGTEAMCGGGNSKVNGSKVTEMPNDKIRLDSVVFWNTGGRIEFIHLVTYLFNWHTFI
ncbi:MAG: prepilin-type N-terminal cleavage/methylation domain-containing protein [Candidatus Paceibacterota bacterium]